MSTATSLPVVSTDLTSAPLGSSPAQDDAGIVFRVWAPHADAVFVIGDFNDWQDEASPLERSGDVWSGLIPGAKNGDEYRYRLVRGADSWTRNDPRAQKVTQSNGNTVIWTPPPRAEGQTFKRPLQHEMVIYEMHVGTFHVPSGAPHGTFASAIEKLPYLQDLGINMIELMPVNEFAGDFSWGYNPAHPWAIESAYGGPEGLLEFVAAAHRLGIGVILDVVYNHFGPGDLDLWQFDGESWGGKGGIYFYSDERALTPWGESRPDYGRGEVRSYIRDNACYLVRQFGLDGLRWDMTAYMRTRDGSEDNSIPEGWSLCAWINEELHREFPGLITIAEDMKENDWIVKPPSVGGAGFSAQWDSAFVHPVRSLLTETNDANRNLDALLLALRHSYDGDGFKRVIYSESHDEVANGKARLPSEIDPGTPESEPARRRSMLGALLALTAPGIPMIFQGQEFLESEWFRDEVPLRWEKLARNGGIHRFYRDAIHLRLRDERTHRALRGAHLEANHVNHLTKVIAYRRWSDEETSCVLVVLNLSTETHLDYRIGVPHLGEWIVVLNTDSSLYSDDFTDVGVTTVAAEAQAQDGCPCTLPLRLGPYSGLVLSHAGETA